MPSSLANERPCVQMDAEDDACRICHKKTLTDDAGSGNSNLTTFSASNGGSHLQRRRVRRWGLCITAGAMATYFDTAERIVCDTPVAFFFDIDQHGVQACGTCRVSSLSSPSHSGK